METLPFIGLGTWRLKGKECIRAIERALGLGYRHIDTAHTYENHSDVGKAIRHFEREALFVTSKLAWEEVSDENVEKSVEKACERALKELGLNFLDLYLLHWPDRKRPIEAVLEAMQGLVQKGKIRRMGVSNFTIHHLQDALRPGLEIFANQVEFHPYLYQKELFEFCSKKGIQLISYRPLGKGALVENPLLKGIGSKKQKTAAQVVLRWIVQKGIPVIPKASSEAHLKENLEIFDFSLSEEEILQIDQLNQNLRFCDADWSEFNY